MCRDTEIDCILLDYWLGADEGSHLIPQFEAANPFCPVIMLTGQGSEQVAATAFKRGAVDYMSKRDLSAGAIADKIATAIEAAKREKMHNDRQDELKRANRLDALGELAGGLAHDFNNLLATAQYAITLARKSVPSSKAQRHLADALAVIETGADLTQRLKSFASSQPNAATARPVGAVLEHFLKLVSAAMGEDIKIVTVADDPASLVHCDQGQLIQALVNLALNAREAMLQSGKGRQIRLDVKSTRSAVDGANRPLLSFTVEDDGPGMTREVHRRAADPYFTTKERSPGRGLGLAMTYGFVQQCDGEFSIETELGKGTKVRMALPMEEAPLRVRSPAAANQPCRIDKARRARILMVDDELLLLAEAAEIVRDFGFDVLEASSAAEALTMIDPDKPIDLLLTDVHMPRMNGFQLAKAVRSQLPDVKILYFSGYTGYSEADMGDVIAPLVNKPCVPEELQTRIVSLLGEEDGAIDTTAPIPVTRPAAETVKQFN